MEIRSISWHDKHVIFTDNSSSSSSVHTDPVDVNAVTLITFVTKVISLCFSSVWGTLYILIRQLTLLIILSRRA